MRNVLLLFLIVIGIEGCKDASLASLRDYVILGDTGSIWGLSDGTQRYKVFKPTFNPNSLQTKAAGTSGQLKSKLIFDTDIAEDCDDVDWKCDLNNILFGTRH